MERIIVHMSGDLVSDAQKENVSVDSILDTLGHELNTLAESYGLKAHIEDVEYV